MILVLVIGLHSGLSSIAQNGNPTADKGDKKESGIFQTDVPAHPYDIICCKPTDHSISLSIYASQDMSCSVQYGTRIGQFTSVTPVQNLAKGKMQVISIDKLDPDQRYYYRLSYTIAGNSGFGETGYFQTARRGKSAFVFNIQADSHLDENASPEMYVRTLNNMAADSADFLVDLGDTWMVDKYRNDFHESLRQYIAQRYYFGLLCRNAALFLTLGNHDGESGESLKKMNSGGMTAWATETRKSFFVNPEPDGFYTGNREPENALGLPENYYSWEWGNALFIVLDPFRYTAGNRSPWQRTLGEKQYQWLKETLQKSKAAFKFVFIHNLVGGTDKKGKARGGAEAAAFYEWGGLDSTGTPGFAANRPGWDKPIHDLLLAAKVNIVFHGHDHFFARQEKDGIIYQLIPQPGATRYGNINSAAEYGYTNGEFRNGPGYLRVSIKEGKAVVEFISSSLDEKRKNKEVIYTYTIPEKK